MRKLDAVDIFFIILGLLLLALAGAVAFSAYGHVKILAILIGAVGIVAVIAGLLTAGVLGAVLAILGIAVIVRFIEVYTIPLAIILALFGIVILIFGLKGSD